MAVVMYSRNATTFLDLVYVLIAPKAILATAPPPAWTSTNALTTMAVAIPVPLVSTLFLDFLAALALRVSTELPSPAVLVSIFSVVF
jgi:hypothetical protein